MHKPLRRWESAVSSAHARSAAAGPPTAAPPAASLCVLSFPSLPVHLVCTAQPIAFFSQALVLTADLSWFGNREADRRNGFTVPPDYSLRQCAGAALAPAWTWDWLTHKPYSYALVNNDVAAESISAYINAQIEPVRASAPPRHNVQPNYTAAVSFTPHPVATTKSLNLVRFTRRESRNSDFQPV